MAVKLDTRTVESSVAAEIYISATPREGTSLQDQSYEIFRGIRQILRSKKAHILQERVFATQATIETISRARSKAYADFDDGVSPSLLVGREGLSGPFAGVQVHAVSSDPRCFLRSKSGGPEVIDVDGRPCGRILHLSGCTLVTLSSISALQFTEATEQARACLEKSESALKQFGADFLSVARTWVWLRDILSWYDDFNRVRNKFFTERGLIGEGSRQSMPASTGIGLGSADGSKCAMDLIAVLGPEGSPQFLPAVGKQQCALEYGSAFSRASRAVTPAGQTVFVSGTASIDARGATTHIADPAGQINTTIENVRAVLADMHCRDEDVVHAVAYCKTTEIEEIFNALKDDLPWPWVTTICDICRPELLFEVEATAMPKPAKTH
jgi:enamine deaminase RidA (YjgF/YER057c/UK114 family)